MRIIAGRWRGRRLAIPRGTSVRPTPDRVRETLFNWLAESIPGATCLDLFAGTGVLGLEALSRGAAETWFVERDSTLIRALRDRVEALNANARVVPGEVKAFLQRPPERRFALVFVDAPYREALGPLLGLLEPWLAAGARVYVERPRTGATGLAALAEALPGSELIKTANAGAVAFGLLQYRRP